MELIVQTDVEKHVNVLLTHQKQILEFQRPPPVWSYAMLTMIAKPRWW